MDHTAFVLCSVENGIGWIRLNRNHALNALNLEMLSRIEQQLEAWKDNEEVKLICFEGGERAFCAGGDIRFLYDQRNGDMEAALVIFEIEYRMDLMIHQYPKPALAYMHGIVMGGGVGIAVGAKHRIATEATKWAMPETNIGFFPDVGASYFMNQMPGQVGRYLALTGEPIRPEDALYAGAADWYMESARWPDLRRALLEEQWQAGAVDLQITELLSRFASRDTPAEPQLQQVRTKIDEHFAFDTLEEIFNSLDRRAAEGDEWAAGVHAVLRAKSPTSLKVTLRLLQEGKSMTLPDCFKMELAAGRHMIQRHDFYEGVRAVLVDKDRSPKWNPSTLEEADISGIIQAYYSC